MMTRWQREVAQSQINDERAAIASLEAAYAQAMNQTAAKIAALDERAEWDVENLQSIIYQRKYQAALNKQLAGILQDLRENEYSTVREYLEKCYQGGYLGAMYDLHKQGIPLILPIDQAAAIEAIVADSKLSASLYTSMGENIERLRAEVRLAVSRGVAAGETWTQTAAKIAGKMSSPYGKALRHTMRIARTEGHRVQVKSTLDAMHGAKERGADVLKQWDSTLDGRTRKSHRKLDGQIRELDEDFTVNGHRGRGPGHFGRPEEDINCRCSITQRARWALDEEELDTLKERAKALGVDKTEDFEDFRRKYLKAAEKVEQVEMDFDRKPGELDVSGWPDAFKTKTARKRIEKFAEVVNSRGKADSKTAELYGKLGSLPWFKAGRGLSVRFAEDNHKVGSTYDGLKIQIPKMEDGRFVGQAQTVAHELGHLIDAASRTRGPWHTEREAMPNIGLGEIPQWVRDESARLKAERDRIYTDLRQKWKDGADDAARRYKAGEIGFDEYNRIYKGLKKDYERGDRDVRELYDSWNAVEDIIDALTRGRARDNGLVNFGHGSKYYRRSESNAIAETWANYCALQLLRPDLVERLRDDFPDLVELMDSLRDEMLDLAKKEA